jgi:hypothetical protein
MQAPKRIAWKRGPSGLPFDERFWRKVDRNGPIPEHAPGLGPCWDWTGHRNRAGYGGVKRDGAGSSLTHRVAWELVIGPIPEGLDLLHKCDRPSCVNPDHLRPGTHAENMADMKAKGRNYVRSTFPPVPPEHRARGDRHWSRTNPEKIPRGEASKRAKVTEDQVRAIRQMRAAGAPRSEVAAAFGVSPSLVSAICLGQIWKHVA